MLISASKVWWTFTRKDSTLKRLGLFCGAILLAGCCAVRHQPQTDPKTEQETVAPALKMETITLYTGAITEPSPNDDPAKRAEWLAKRNREWKERLSATCGVTWPEGSSLTWGYGDIIRVTNTAENLLTLIKQWSDKSECPEIETVAQIVEAGPEALAAVGIVDKGRIDDASEISKTLLKRDDARLLENFRLLAKCYSECSAMACTEYIYPTEYVIGSVAATTNDVPCTTSIATVVPANFETREVGVSIQMIAEIEDIDYKIKYMLNVTVTGEPTWKDYSLRIPGSETTVHRLPMEQPFFPNLKLATQFTATPDKTTAMVMGGLARSKEDGSPGKVLILFLTPHLISRQDGNIFSPVRLAPEP